MTMTNEESEAAFKGYKDFRERFAFRKKYKDLKEGKPLRYYFSPGQKLNDYVKELSCVSRRVRKSNTVTVATQSINDFR
ncbi:MULTISPECIES: hypothetical protein [unclassified Sporosarcina]|uniref:hypothetical protein n=1 Tax=unclassified Sporosarcina TaxID=2647733 RepID=UPI001A938394|nr:MULTISPECIES: hypothetical protein [unclassified Sporosarcina]MBO0587589.1 hypothetical protein [Sporosarcina sp. E16_8]MBO0602423.1 hypothetical protein [Sporosarcina sp. E16_3]